MGVIAKILPFGSLPLLPIGTYCEKIDLPPSPCPPRLFTKSIRHKTLIDSVYVSIEIFNCHLSNRHDTFGHYYIHLHSLK